MGKFIDLINREFTRLLVIKRVENNKWGQVCWLCLCDCGNIKVVLGDLLRSGVTKSCGCLQREQSRISNRTHGLSHTPEYQVLEHAKSRCDDPNNPQYKDYGGRGIKFCTRWRGSNGLVNFLKDVGPRPGPGYTLERIDNDGNYEPGNCKWATKKEQANNRRVFITQRLFKATSIIGREHTSNNQNKFARDHNLSQSHINNCLHGRYKQHKGWTFTYI